MKKIGQLADQLSDNREKSKVRTLIDSIRHHKKVLAYDATVITLDYLHKLLQREHVKAKIIVAAGTQCPR